MKQKLRTFLLLPLFVLMVFVSAVSGQDVQIHYFNFNTNVPATNANWDQPIAATIGSGSLTYTFAQAYGFAGTAINGNEAEETGSSFCPRGGPDNEGNGKYFTLALPTTGYEHIVITYPTRRTSTGFTTHTIEYSANGQEWVEFRVMDISDYPSAWSADAMVELDFSGIAAANNNPEFRVRFVLTGATTEPGNNRFDNISVRGNTAGGTNAPETAAETVLAYPNPAHHILYVYTTSETDHISLVDLTGRTVYETRLQGLENQLGIDVSGLAAGTYLLRVVVDNQVSTQKIQLSR